MTQIRDETDGHLFGVDPVKELEWAIRDWSPGERAEFHEFILVNGALSAKRVENEIYRQGGTAMAHGGVRSHVFWLPEAGLVGVFNLRHECEMGRSALPKTCFRSIRNWLSGVEHRVDIRLDVTLDAYTMLAEAQLMIIHRENSLSKSQARRKAKEVYRCTDMQCSMRVLSSVLLRLPLLVPSMLQGLKAYRASKDNHSTNLPTALDGAADSPSDGTSLESTPEPGGAETTKTVTVRDETGELIYNVDMTRIVRWALRIWKPQDMAGLTEIVVVGDDLIAKRVETKLLKKGAHPFHQKDDMGCVYVLKNSGVVHVINMASIRSRALASRKGSKLNLPRRLYGRLRYKGTAKNRILREIPRGLAAAKIAIIQKEKKLSRKATRDLESSIYWDFRFASTNKLILSTLFPALLLILLVEWSHRRIWWPAPESNG